MNLRNAVVRVLDSGCYQWFQSSTQWLLHDGWEDHSALVLVVSTSKHLLEQLAGHWSPLTFLLSREMMIVSECSNTLLTTSREVVVMCVAGHPLGKAPTAGWYFPSKYWCAYCRAFYNFHIANTVRNMEFIALWAETDLRSTQEKVVWTRSSAIAAGRRATNQ